MHHEWQRTPGHVILLQRLVAWAGSLCRVHWSIPGAPHCCGQTGFRTECTVFCITGGSGAETAREAIAELGHQLAMHVVAMKPPYVSHTEGADAVGMSVLHRGLPSACCAARPALLSYQCSV